LLVLFGAIMICAIIRRGAGKHDTEGSR
jgi:hypothetical protein